MSAHTHRSNAMVSFLKLLTISFLLCSPFIANGYTKQELIQLCKSDKIEDFRKLKGFLESKETFDLSQIVDIQENSLLHLFVNTLCTSPLLVKLNINQEMEVNKGAPKKEVKLNSDIDRSKLSKEVEGVLRKLISRIDINVKNVNGFSPLSIAAMEDNVELVRFLVSEGANIDEEVRGGKTIIFYTANKGQYGMTLILIRLGARVEINGNSLVFEAVRLRDTKMLDVILRHSDVDLGFKQKGKDIFEYNKDIYQRINKVLLDHRAKDKKKQKSEPTKEPKKASNQSTTTQPKP